MFLQLVRKRGSESEFYEEEVGGIWSAKNIWENCVIRRNDGFFFIEKCVDVKKYVGIAGYSSSLRNDSLKTWFHRKISTHRFSLRYKQNTVKKLQQFYYEICLPHKAHSPYCYYLLKIPQWPPKPIFMCAENEIKKINTKRFSVTFSDFFTFTVWVFLYYFI